MVLVLYWSWEWTKLSLKQKLLKKMFQSFPLGPNTDTSKMHRKLSKVTVFCLRTPTFRKLTSSFMASALQYWARFLRLNYSVEKLTWLFVSLFRRDSQKVFTSLTYLGIQNFFVQTYLISWLFFRVLNLYRWLHWLSQEIREQSFSSGADVYRSNVLKILPSTKELCFSTTKHQ